jgi:hypothetical protein
METLAATPQITARQGFKPWEWALLLLAIPVFLVAVTMYVTDFPVLRKYVLHFEQTTTAGVRVGQLSSATGKVRRQGATESEFLPIAPGEVLHNQDTVVTDPGVSAAVKLDDGGTIELASDTMVKLAFDTEFSIGGITRQANVELVTGAVTGQATERKILVRTTTGKTATLGAESLKQVVREEPVVPKKVELVVDAVPVKVIEAKLPPAIEVPAAARVVELAPPPPPPPPKPKILPATLSSLIPAPGARVAPPANASTGRVRIALEFETSRPDGKYRLQLKTAGAWLGGALLDETVAARAGKVAVPVFLEKPGSFEWSIEDLDANAPLGTHSFELTSDFEAITLLDATAPGSRGLTNRIAADLVTSFPGFLLAWNPVPDARSYEVSVFRDERGKAVVFSGETNEPRLLLKKGELTTEPFYFRVSARLKSGFRALSSMGKFRLSFLPPALARPADRAAISVTTPRTPILLTWSHTNFTSEYMVQISRNPTFADMEISRSVTDNFFSYLPREPGTYYWRVRSISPTAKSEFSAARNFTMR